MFSRECGPIAAMQPAAERDDGGIRTLSSRQGTRGCNGFTFHVSVAACRNMIGVEKLMGRRRRRIRAALTEQAFSVAWAHGRAMTTEQTIA